MSYTLTRSHTDDELATSAASDLLTALRSRKNLAIPYAIALSGGRIARTFFKEIVKAAAPGGDASSAKPLFQNVHFFWGDERCVPPTDPESNYGAASELLLKPLGIPDSQIHRVRGEGSEPLALREAVSDLCSVAPVVNGQPILDLVILGMGEDGHVASLFPGEPDDVIKSPEVFRAVTAVKPPPRRITIGYAVIFAAKEVWVIAAGAGKEGALKESLSSRGKTPLARVLAQRAQTRILTDIPA